METQPPDPQNLENSIRTIVDNLDFGTALPREKAWFAKWLGKKYPELVIEAMLWAVGDDPTREGLRNTPRRVVTSWEELYAGYKGSPDHIFTEGSDKGFACEHYDQMIVLRDIPFSSTCEHHLLPFAGVAHVAYIPNAHKLLGISKLARLVELHARRLQNQERITQDVVDDLMKVSNAQGAGVQLVASHNCMVCRGVMKPGSEMITTALRDNFQDPGVKAEFLSAIHR